MEKALATFHNGHVELDQPVNWPDGTRLEVVPADGEIGEGGSERPESSEAITEWLEWFKTVEPFDMTTQELDAFEAELRTSKEVQKKLLRERWKQEDCS